MSPPVLVDLDPRTHRHFGALPAKALVGTYWQLLDGTVVRVRPDGGADEVVQAAYPQRGIAADPVPGRVG